MARFRFYLLSALLLCSLALSQGASSFTTDPPVTVPVPDVTKSSTPVPATTTTTVKPTTTEKSTTTTSTTEKPTTTTSTTEKPTTTTTTKKPSTTTVAPTPPPKPVPPKPLPAPTPGNWSYTDKNVTCVMVKFAAQLNVIYTITDSPTAAHALLNVPADAAVVGGTCGNTTQSIQLSWPAATWANKMTLLFLLNETTHQYALSSLNVTLAPDNFPNATSNSSILLWHAAREWWTPVAISYKCTPATQLNMTEDSGAVATLTLSSMQEEAFRKDGSTKFSAARECGGGDIPDVVPIAVGCALGLLVVVVLVAYLVARRRGARGYLSM